MFCLWRNKHEYMSTFQEWEWGIWIPHIKRFSLGHHVMWPYTIYAYLALCTSKKMILLMLGWFGLLITTIPSWSFEAISMFLARDMLTSPFPKACNAVIWVWETILRPSHHLIFALLTIWWRYSNCYWWSMIVLCQPFCYQCDISRQSQIYALI